MPGIPETFVPVRFTVWNSVAVAVGTVEVAAVALFVFHFISIAAVVAILHGRRGSSNRFRAAAGADVSAAAHKAATAAASDVAGPLDRSAMYRIRFPAVQCA